MAYEEPIRVQILEAGTAAPIILDSYARCLEGRIGLGWVSILSDLGTSTTIVLEIVGIDAECLSAFT
jgi:hypothetical protein